jgi:hypothetical protein
MKRIFLASLLIVLACKKESAAPTASFIAAASPNRAVQSVVGSAPTPGQAAQASAQAAQPQTRMIIRNANMSLVVRDAADVLHQVTTLVDAKGGYVADTRQWKEREQVRASATVRVPAAQLMPTLAAIRGLAIRVEAESVNAQDVSQRATSKSPGNGDGIARAVEDGS